MGDEFFYNKDDEKNNERSLYRDVVLGCFGAIVIGTLITFGFAQFLKFFSVDSNQGLIAGFIVAVVMDIIAIIYFNKYSNRRYIGTGAMIPLVMILFFALIASIVVGGCFLLIGIGGH